MMNEIKALFDRPMPLSTYYDLRKNSNLSAWKCILDNININYFLNMSTWCQEKNIPKEVLKMLRSQIFRKIPDFRSPDFWSLTVFSLVLWRNLTDHFIFNIYRLNFASKWGNIMFRKHIKITYRNSAPWRLLILSIESNQT